MIICVPRLGINPSKALGRFLAYLLPLSFILTSCGSNRNNVPTPTPVSAAELAKNIPDQEIKNYAKAVVAIEQIRKTTNQEMATLAEGKKFDAVHCTQPETISGLPTKMQELAFSFCNKARAISEANGLTIPRFNAITTNAQKNAELQRKITEQLTVLQN